MSLLQEIEQFGLADCEFNRKQLSKKQITAIKCAFADLQGALQAFNQMDIHAHDWDAHAMSIDDLLNAFDFLGE
jgi:hypothetical protein